MADTLNLRNRLEKVSAELTGVTKSGHNQFEKYDYVTIDDINLKLKPALEKHGVIIRNVKEERLSDEEPFVKYEGKAWIYSAMMTVAVENADNPEDSFTQTFPFWGTNKAPEKARGTALTYARRYMLRDLFHLNCGEDDADGMNETPQGTTKAAKPKPKVTPQTPDPALATAEQIQSLYDVARRKGFDEGRVRDVIAKECGNAPMTVEQYEKILKPLMKREDKVPAADAEGEIKETAA